MRQRINENAGFRKTIYACFTGYVVQAVVNNFVPLLFLTFHQSYGIPLSRITFLVTVNFAVQLLVDLLSVGFVDRIGYRASLILGHALSALGLVFLAFLPDLLPDPYAGILLSAVCYAIGGGLLEVVVSPVVEACPTPNKESAMSLLHSFYCWGHVGVVLFSTAFFAVFGIRNWRVLALIWAVLPVVNLIAFTRVPIAPLLKEGETGTPLPVLLRTRLFWIFLLMMICAGASEQAVSQWASAFAEKGLGLSKAAGDLAGPLSFAAAMGTARAIYGKYGSRLPLRRFMTGSAILCLCSYLLISLAPHPLTGLLGCGLCGFSVGIMWPGTFSMATASLPAGGTAMFALLALGGDFGCSGGPTLAGLVSSAAGDDLRKGILAAAVFPALLTAVLLLKRRE